MDWKRQLLTDDAQIHALLKSARRIAVLGIKPDSDAGKPAHAVPQYLKEQGFQILPVPIKSAQSILGEPTYTRVADVPGDVDIVEVFRKPEDIEAHLDDILRKR